MILLSSKTWVCHFSPKQCMCIDVFYSLLFKKKNYFFARKKSLHICVSKMQEAVGKMRYISYIVQK